MKKFFIIAGMLSAGAFYAQEGTVGINVVSPQATLDVNESADVTEKDLGVGVSVPRVTRERLNKITTTDKIATSALVYVTDFSAAAGAMTGKIDAVGYYYFDGTEWVKLGSGAGSSSTSTTTNLTNVKGNIRTLDNIKSSDWEDNDFTILLSTATTMQLPDPTLPKNEGRIVVVRNLTSTGKTFNGNFVPVGNSGIKGYQGVLLQATGGKWYVISSF